MESLAGRVALVSGATGGVGSAIATGLADAGARVLITARDPGRGHSAIQQIARNATGSPPELIQLDLADLNSVRAGIDAIQRATPDGIDLIVNNAAIMAVPFSLTADGFESQWATNVLGPTLLTWSLLDNLNSGARVGFMTSNAHRLSRLEPDHVQGNIRGDRYTPWGTYADTKLVDLVLATALQGHFDRLGSPALAVAAHPGMTRTDLYKGAVRDRPRSLGIVMGLINRAGQSTRHGAEPMLHALAADEVRGGDFFGPSRLGETRGRPKPARRSSQASLPGLDMALISSIESAVGISAPS